MSRRVDVCETADETVARVVELIRAIAPRTVALSGGSSPKPVYERLRAAGVLADAEVWLVDERCVPSDHQDSNALLLRETLSPQHMHRPVTEDGCDAAAQAYDDELVARMGAEPVFDLILLGMGPDGHTASLFPGAPEIAERVLRAVSTRDAHNGHRRITLTLPVLNRARHSIFHVVGGDKAAAFARVQDGELVPAARVLGATWIVDRAVATAPEPVVRRKKSDPIEGQESLFDV